MMQRYSCVWGYSTSRRPYQPDCVFLLISLISSPSLDGDLLISRISQCAGWGSASSSLCDLLTLEGTCCFACQCASDPLFHAGAGSHLANRSWMSGSLAAESGWTNLPWCDQSWGIKHRTGGFCKILERQLPTIYWSTRRKLAAVHTKCLQMFNVYLKQSDYKPLRFNRTVF